MSGPLLDSNFDSIEAPCVCECSPRPGHRVNLDNRRSAALFPCDDNDVLLEFVRTDGDKTVTTRVRISREACVAFGLLILDYVKNDSTTELALAVTT